jgi:hypothetical protein
MLMQQAAPAGGLNFDWHQGLDPQMLAYMGLGRGGAINATPIQPTALNINTPQALTPTTTVAPLTGFTAPNEAGQPKNFLGQMGGPMGIANAGLGLVQTIGSLWSAYNANKLAKEQFRFTKGITETNLANQIQSYNTALGDRARSRAGVEGQTDAQRDAYIRDNQLRDRRNG